MNGNAHTSFHLPFEGVLNAILPMGDINKLIFSANLETLDSKTYHEARRGFFSVISFGYISLNRIIPGLTQQLKNRQLSHGMR